MFNLFMLYNIVFLMRFQGVGNLFTTPARIYLFYSTLIILLKFYSVCYVGYSEAVNQSHKHMGLHCNSMNTSATVV